LRCAQKLTARAAATSKPGRYGDGSGLYLVVSSTGDRKWVFRFTFDGRVTEMGLRSAEIVSLAEARDKAHAGRKIRGAGKIQSKPNAKPRRARPESPMGNLSSETNRGVAAYSRLRGWRDPGPYICFVRTKFDFHRSHRGQRAWPARPRSSCAPDCVAGPRVCSWPIPSSSATCSRRWLSGNCCEPAICRTAAPR
jgi:hypothetical protein